MKTFNTRTSITLLFVVCILALNVILMFKMSPDAVANELPSPTHHTEQRPLVAILTAVSSSSQPAAPAWNESLSPLCSRMLPSLIDSLNCEYRYMVVVGYESGDSFYDSPKGLAELISWFRDNVHTPMKQRNIEIDLVTVRAPSVGNSSDMSSTSSTRAVEGALECMSAWLTAVTHKVSLWVGLEFSPCCWYTTDVLQERVSVVSAMAREAYSRGADFLYRVYDDSLFFGRWAKPFVSLLVRAGRPYGVIGASSFRAGSSNNVLQHHFVHRTHLELFDMHFYPPALEEWGQDLWISRVYGVHRTFITKHIGSKTHRAIKAPPRSVRDRAGHVAAWVNSSRGRVHRWLEQDGSSNQMTVAERQGLYTSVGGPVMQTLGVKPELENMDLECSSTSSGMVSPRFRWCLIMKDKHDLVTAADVKERAGRMSHFERVKWAAKNCSLLVLDPVAKNRFFVSGGGGSKKAHARPLNLQARPPLVHCTRAGTDADPRAAVAVDAGAPAAAALDSSSLPLIAVMAATTSRKVELLSNTSISLMSTMLPSLIHSLDCGFRYVVVVGFDDSDHFYNSSAGTRMVADWFNRRVGSVMRARGVSVRLRLLRVHNNAMKPGPVFLEMARAAYDMGAEYMYRVNDDTEFIERWPRVFVEALRRLSPSGGVIGPRSFNTDNRILTHDFVHRSHMLIFNLSYYPVELVDWWMDDWISSVYGPARSFMSRDVTIYHHTTAHGKRYKVEFQHEQLLPGLVAAGRMQVQLWMHRHGAPGIIDQQQQQQQQQLASKGWKESGGGGGQEGGGADEGGGAKLRYYSAGGVVEDYFPISCPEGRGAAAVFCPPPKKATGPPRVPDLLTSS